MAKKKAKAITYSNKHGHLLRVHSCFVYEVEVYVNTPRSYYLYDTRRILLNEWRTDGAYYKVKATHGIRTYYTLLAAPIDWLEEHNYTKNA